MICDDDISPVLDVAVSSCRSKMYFKVTHLRESNSSRLLTEALTAEIEAVLADKTSLVSAEPAII